MLPSRQAKTVNINFKMHVCVYGSHAKDFIEAIMPEKRVGDANSPCYSFYNQIYGSATIEIINDDIHYTGEVRYPNHFILSSPNLKDDKKFIWIVIFEEDHTKINVILNQLKKENIENKPLNFYCVLMPNPINPSVSPLNNNDSCIHFLLEDKSDLRALIANFNDHIKDNAKAIIGEMVEYCGVKMLSDLRAQQNASKFTETLYETELSTKNKVLQKNNQAPEKSSHCFFINKPDAKSNHLSKKTVGLSKCTIL